MTDNCLISYISLLQRQSTDTHRQTITSPGAALLALKTAGGKSLPFEIWLFVTQVSLNVTEVPCATVKAAIGERQTDRQIETETKRQRHTQRHRDRDRQTKAGRETDRQTETEREAERQTDRDMETENDTDRERERGVCVCVWGGISGKPGVKMYIELWLPEVTHQCFVSLFVWLGQLESRGA